jgi:AcrR family transcriptional regulator
VPPEGPYGRTVEFLVMAALDAETIMVATEDVLRRYGPAKATVVDVARALGVSHAAVYRHFGSKAALREAVARRWLAQKMDVLDDIAADQAAPPPQRLRDWTVALFREKRRQAVEEPELFATFLSLVSADSTVAVDHVAAMMRQLESVVAAGMTSGDFAAGDPAATARVVFEATAAFHYPPLWTQWTLPDREDALGTLLTLIINGLGVDSRS